MKTTYLVCYDIRNDKRLRKVAKICEDFGERLQYSVFECDLVEPERVRLAGRLSDVIHHEDDQILFVNLGPAEGRGDRVIQTLGAPYHKMDSPCYVV